MKTHWFPLIRPAIALFLGGKRGLVGGLGLRFPKENESKNFCDGFLKLVVGWSSWSTQKKNRWKFR